MGLPLITIVGRPNVGKSALFNRLLKRSAALIHAAPGVTRDRLYGTMDWKGCRFRLCDSGGLHLTDTDPLQEAVERQVEAALGEADAVLLVVDARAGLIPLDWRVADWIRRRNKPVLVVANKVEGAAQEEVLPELFSLGFGDPVPVSALHGRRIGELLDQVAGLLGARGKEPAARAPEPRGIRVAIVGRPNVGKSSILNRLLGVERAIVSELPGTTRDPIEAGFRYLGNDFTLIDTAGIRARRKLKSGLDVIARLRSLRVLERADVCWVILDGGAGILDDDLQLLAEVTGSGKPFSVAINKWDLADPKPQPAEVRRAFARRAPFAAFASVMPISAKSGRNVLSALSELVETYLRSRRAAPEADLKRLLKRLQSTTSAPVAVRNARFFNLKQAGTPPPTVFQLRVRIKRRLTRNDLAFLERVFREELDLTGVPIHLRILAR
ncbi:MAG: ribosome biogenesis GTPase Der [Candidatus Omnitrophica bacterium CG11_big_fil_rev_8_21_14_0_20_64_10]|nr:MAG: ribosome biogenesis GTPase Der [Candidatus Omnitrophica bacterium CG11_big_fil_rev_8_21_14_0_20_64_10]